MHPHLCISWFRAHSWNWCANTFSQIYTWFSWMALLSEPLACSCKGQAERANQNQSCITVSVSSIRSKCKMQTSSPWFDSWKPFRVVVFLLISPQVPWLGRKARCQIIPAVSQIQHCYKHCICLVSQNWVTADAHFLQRTLKDARAPSSLCQLCLSSEGCIAYMKTTICVHVFT